MIHQPKTSFAMTFSSVAMISFGLTMLLMSVIYTRDLSLLVNAPLAIWSVVCGQPSNDPLTLPLLVTLSGTALLAGLVLFIIILARRFRGPQNEPQD